MAKKTTKIDPKQPYAVGKLYCIRTVTMIYTGRLLVVGPQELVLANAGWIADTGRYNEFLRTGIASEVEMYPKNKTPIVGRGSITDACEMDTIPMETK